MKLNKRTQNQTIRNRQKNYVELMPSNSSSKPITVSYGTITEIRDNSVIAKISDSSQLIPSFIHQNEQGIGEQAILGKIEI